jgi:hypothetical protein
VRETLSRTISGKGLFGLVGDAESRCRFSWGGTATIKAVLIPKRQVDSEIIATSLNHRNYRILSPEKADDVSVKRNGSRTVESETAQQ